MYKDVHLQLLMFHVFVLVSFYIGSFHEFVVV